MTDTPKIVIDRLRAALPDQAHPDADLLTAFAEQTLSPTEREGVLEHLALCGDCREVIVVALPAADIADAPAAIETETVRIRQRQAKPERSWLNLVWPTLAGPNLRWAALAAGVVLAASLLMVHPGKMAAGKAESGDGALRKPPERAYPWLPSRRSHRRQSHRRKSSCRSNSKLDHAQQASSRHRQRPNPPKP